MLRLQLGCIDNYKLYLLEQTLKDVVLLGHRAREVEEDDGGLHPPQLFVDLLNVEYLRLRLIVVLVVACKYHDLAPLLLLSVLQERGPPLAQIYVRPQHLNYIGFLAWGDG